MSQYRRGYAVAAFITGALSLVLGPLLAIAGVLFGHIARSRAMHYPHQYKGEGLALTGLIMSYFSLAVAVILIAAAVHLNSTGRLTPILDRIDTSKTLSSGVESLTGMFAVNAKPSGE